MGGELIPILGMLSGVVITGLIMKGAVAITRLQTEARRAAAGTDPEVLAALGTLREQMESLQQQLADTQERLEFTERLMIRDRSGTPGEGA